jgi:hypothetical protein
MTRARYHRFLLAGLLFVLGIALGSSFFATVKKHPIDSVEQSSTISTQKENGGQEQEEPFWEAFALRTISDPVTLYTLILTFFTGMLWRSTEKLWNAGERQRKVSELAVSKAHAANEITAAQFMRAYKPEIDVEIIEFKLRCARMLPNETEDSLRMPPPPEMPERFIGLQGLIKIRNVGNGSVTVVGCTYGICIFEQNGIGTVRHQIGDIMKNPIEGYQILRAGDTCSAFPSGFGPIESFYYAVFGYSKVDRDSFSNFIMYTPAMIGTIDYIGPLGDRWRKGFAFQRKQMGAEQGHSTRFWGGEKYNYDKKIQDKQV